MDCRFLEKQLLLMSNISERYLSLIPKADWGRLINLAVEKDDFIQGIIKSETKPIVQKRAYEAYSRFIDTVLDHKEPLDMAA